MPLKTQISPFSKKVIRLIQAIPQGKVATYGQIARLAGQPHAARGVGWILNSSTKAHGLPWQRVINSRGEISFHKESVEYATQKRLLKREGVIFSPGDRVELARYQWKRSRPQRIV